MGCGASVCRGPKEILELQGKYAKAIVDDGKIAIINGPNRPLIKVAVVKYKNAFTGKLKKLEETVLLVDGLSTTVNCGDAVATDYTVKDSLESFHDVNSGLETHVVLHRSDEPPERFVVGYGNSPTRRYRARYDNPARTAMLVEFNSPKKKYKPLLNLAIEWKKVVEEKTADDGLRAAAAAEAKEEWQVLPYQVQ